MRLLDSTRTTFGTKLSDHIWKDNNGQLICRDCIIARTGSYDYLESEIIEGGDKNKIVKVFRTDDEVFDPTSIASFENKPFVDDHPLENVTPENYRELSKGYMINVRRGTGEHDNCLMCDVVITDPDTIDLVVSGKKRELSLGYDTVIKEDRSGNYYMTAIRGNHLALVDDGRAGCATIRDSASKVKGTGGMDKMSKKQKISLFDEDIFEVEEIQEDEDVAVEEVPQEIATEEVVEEKHDEEPTLAEIKALLLEIKGMLGVKDSEEEVVEAAEEEVKQPDIVGDEDPVEEIQEGEEEIVEEEDCNATKDCGDKLLDADEVIEEEKTIAKDSKSVYKKFSKVTDSNKEVKSDAINKSFQDRYNRAANKI